MTPEEKLAEAEAALDAAKAALVALEHPVSTPADESVSAPAAVADAPVVPSSALPSPPVAEVTEGKRGPMIKNGKLYPSVR